MLVWLNEVGRDDVAVVGGKAASLGEMIRARIPLPPGFCLTAGAYRRFVDSAGLADAVAQALATPGVAEGDTLACEAASAHIRARFEAAALPADLEVAIRDAYARLGDDARVAVRSSATAEDLPDASFAGQQETYLNVRGIAAVFKHVRRCWSSLWTARAISYRTRQGFDHGEVALAVVLQAMIDAEVAGILFTLNPVTGRRDEMLINASWGLGEAVVSGMVTPDTFRVSRRGLRLVRETLVGSKTERIVALPEGGTVTEPVPGALRARPSLDRRDLAELRALGARVEAHYGVPQDIEWAIAGGKLYLLQARPVTTAGGAAGPVLGRTRRTILEDILEHYPDPPMPLDHAAVTEGYEQLQHAMRDLGVRATRADEVIRMDAEGICRVHPSLPRPAWGILALPWWLWASLRTNPLLWRQHLDEEVKRARQALEQTSLLALSDPELAAYIRSAMDLAARIARVRFRDVVIPMSLRGAWLQLLARIAGSPAGQFEWLAGLSYKTVQVEAGLQALADAVLASPELRAVFDREAPEGIAAALERTPDGRRLLEQLDAFLREHGARTMKVYLPFSNRSWREDRAALYATLRALVRAETPGGADARMAAGLERFNALRTRVAAALPRALRGTFHRTVDAFRLDHVGREETLYRIEEAFVLARRGVDEAAARLHRAGIVSNLEDIQLARLEELLAVLRREQSATSLTRVFNRRRARRDAAVAAWKSQRPLPAVSSGEALRGVAGSPGLASGPVRVVRDVEDFGKLSRGDVLVCPFTDPTWTPLFSLACGVVADTGGPLSHAAIVAREYGIPAVLGMKVGTRELRDGELVVVDGVRGEVRRVAAQ